MKREKRSILARSKYLSIEEQLEEQKTILASCTEFFLSYSREKRKKKRKNVERKAGKQDKEMVGGKKKKKKTRQSSIHKKSLHSVLEIRR